jgi:hypothetical protein
MITEMLQLLQCGLFTDEWLSFSTCGGAEMADRVWPTMTQVPLELFFLV